MCDTVKLSYTVSNEDFTRAGEASSDVKRHLKKMGSSPEVVRKVAIAMYEGEINMVIHANGGTISVEISPDDIIMILKDVGPGIPDIDEKILPQPRRTASGGLHRRFRLERKNPSTEKKRCLHRRLDAR